MPCGRRLTGSKLRPPREVSTPNTGAAARGWIWTRRVSRCWASRGHSGCCGTVGGALPDQRDLRGRDFDRMEGTHVRVGVVDGSDGLRGRATVVAPAAARHPRPVPHPAAGCLAAPGRRHDRSRPRRRLRPRLAASHVRGGRQQHHVFDRHVPQIRGQHEFRRPVKKKKTLLAQSDQQCYPNQKATTATHRWPANGDRKPQ